jgi:hypothetical protein
VNWRQSELDLNFIYGHKVHRSRISKATLRELNNFFRDKPCYWIGTLVQPKRFTGFQERAIHRFDQFWIECLPLWQGCDWHDGPQNYSLMEQPFLVAGALSARALIYSNTPDFEGVAVDTFKGVEVARGALRLYSVQTHF